MALKQKDNPKKVFFASIPIMFGLILFMLCNYSIFLICILAGGFSLRTIPLSVWLFCFVIPSVTPFSNANRFFAVVKINEKGVTRSIFGFFGKRTILWEEMVEIRLKSYSGTWLFFSKQPLEHLYYNDVIKRKDVIQATMTAEIVNAIRFYTNQEIIGYNENMQ